VDGPAIKVGFKDGAQKVEVVPAIYLGPGMLPPPADNYPLYVIPDGDSGWITTSPDAHNRYIDEQNRRSGGMQRNVAKLVKLWRNSHSHLAMSSFFIELLLIEADICKPGRGYARSLRKTFRALAQKRWASINDPLGISGRISVARTSAQRTQLREQALQALRMIDEAFDYEQRGETVEALECWERLFDVEFDYN
jgi:hypothetical protein